MRDGCVPCVLEFAPSLASQAVNVQAISESEEEEFLLPPYARCVVRSVSAEQAPGRPRRFEMTHVLHGLSPRLFKMYWFCNGFQDFIRNYVLH